MKSFKTERLVLKLYVTGDKEKLIALFTDEWVMKHADEGGGSTEKNGKPMEKAD